MNDEERKQLNDVVEKKATCPFIGSAVAQGKLPFQNLNNPLAKIEDVRRLGNSGGGDLGDLLVLFAEGNHAFMRSSDGQLNLPVPEGSFSLEFPGSQGSHAGHSGILQGDPKTLGSGRLSPKDFARLTNRARDGVIKRSDVGRFIAENLATDSNSKVFDIDMAALLAHDFVALGSAAVLAARDKLKNIFGFGASAGTTPPSVKQKLTALLGANNLLGSAGEFSLCFAFLANSPRTRVVDGEPALTVTDLEDMFVHKRLPDGWENWKKSRADWFINLAFLAEHAAVEYGRQRKTTTPPT